MIDRNVELLPNLVTTTGWIGFQVPSLDQFSGTWKLAMYDVPTSTNEAGQTTRKTQFEIKTVATKFVDTYEVSLTQRKLVASKAMDE